MALKRATVLGLPVDAVGLDEALDAAERCAERGEALQIVTINAEMSIQALGDPELAAIISRAGLVLPDGSGVVWALGRQGIKVRKLAGIDFAQGLAGVCARKGWPMFLLGAAPGIAEAAARTLMERHPGLIVAGHRDGYFPSEADGEVVSQIRNSGAKAVLVALGVPRQEKWIARHLEDLGIVAMGVGGSLDVFAGRVPRAPAAFRALHLEWLFRLIKEPWRWQRMAGALPHFAWRVFWEKEKSA